MANAHLRSVFRILASLALAAVLVGVIAFALAAGFGTLKREIASNEYRALREELETDPIAVRLRSESEQRCDRVDREFYWICGAVIEAKPFLARGYCSTAERPLYYGSLDTASQTDLLGDLKFEHVVRANGVLVSPANSETPYAYPHVFPPKEILAREPGLPSDPNRISYDWVNYEGMPILFASGSLNWSLTAEERTNLPVGIIFIHPEFPLRIVTSVPKNQIDEWRSVVNSASSTVIDAVISFDEGQSCSTPPEKVRFLYNIHNHGKLKALRDWVRDNHKLTSPMQ